MFRRPIFFPLPNIVPLALNVLCHVVVHRKTSFGQITLQSQAKGNISTFIFLQGTYSLQLHFHIS